MMKRFAEILKKTGLFLVTIICMITALLVFSIHWMFDTWNNLTMDELVFHLTAPLEGTNEGMIKEYILKCALPAIIIFLLAIIILIYFRKSKKYFMLLILMVSCSFAISILAIGYTWNKLDVSTYMDAQGTESTYIENNYVSPADVKITFPQKKRNLIYIFLESMEMTYADKKNGGAFE